jgi:competence protein ComEC
VLRCAPDRRWKQAGTALCLLSAVCAGTLFRVLPAVRDARPFFGLENRRVAYCSGTAAGDLQRSPGGGGALQLELEQVSGTDGSRASAKGRVRIYLPAARPLYRGQQLRVHVAPQAKSGKGSGPGPVSVRAAGPAAVQGWGSAEARLRAVLQERIRGTLRSLGAEEGDLLTALLLGFKREGVFGAADEFRRAGTAHLLALSGMHLGALYLCALFCGYRLLGRRAAAVIACAAVAGYLWLVGPRPALLRAGLMCLLATVVYLRRGRRPDTLSLLALCFILQVLLVPGSCTSISFLLSYLALAGIVLAAGPIAGLLPFWLPPALRLPIAVGAAAQLCTVALLAAVFGRVYPVGVLATLLLAPAVTALLYAGLAFLLCAFLPGTVMAPGLLWRIEDGLELLIAVLYRFCREVAGAAASLPGVDVGEGAVLPAALLSGIVLTLLLTGAYAVSAVRRRRSHGRESDETTAGLRFPEGHTAFPAGAGDRPRPPLWAELPDQPGGAGEDHRAA